MQLTGLEPTRQALKLIRLESTYLIQVQLLDVLVEQVDGDGVLSLPVVPAGQLGRGAVPVILLTRIAGVQTRILAITSAKMGKRKKGSIVLFFEEKNYINLKCLVFPERSQLNVWAR